MSKGMEMLVSTVMKSLNIDTEQVIDQFKGAQNLLVSSVKNFDERLQAIEKVQYENKELVSKLIQLIEGKQNGN